MKVGTDSLSVQDSQIPTSVSKFRQISYHIRSCEQSRDCIQRWHNVNMTKQFRFTLSVILWSIITRRSILCLYKVLLYTAKDDELDVAMSLSIVLY